jgi:hypothetical protein
MTAEQKFFFALRGHRELKPSHAGTISTGLAFLRRDGFASREGGEAGGTLTTRLLRFGGQCLFVNAATADGDLRVEVLDRSGRAIEPLSQSNCAPISGDSTRQRVSWKGRSTLDGLRDTSVKFRFHLRGGRLYSFWVSRTESGAGGGPVAAGGPGLRGAADESGTTVVQPGSGG